MKKNINGDKKSFKKSWKVQKERTYNHWTKGEPQNQVQLAFRNHWEVFLELMQHKKFNKGKRCLDVGCGRGGMSAYFIDAGFDCNLLDISPEVIDAAKKILKQNDLKANLSVGDANKLPFEDSSFDVVFSIGLLEHFENIEKPIREQVRILDKGGLFIGYVVPRYTNNIQSDYHWINNILKIYHKDNEQIAHKEKLFRSDSNSKFYAKILKKLGLKSIGASGIYSLPMISHSIDFPFSLMPAEAEKELVRHFKAKLQERRDKFNKYPWLCKEGRGQAFLIWGYKQ